MIVSLKCEYHQINLQWAENSSTNFEKSLRSVYYFILFPTNLLRNLSLAPLPWTCIDWLCPLCNRTGITTSAPVSCCLMVAHWLLEVRPAHWPSGIWLLRHLASRLSSPPQPRRATPWPSAPMPKSASPAAAMETSPSGTCTTRLSLGWKKTLAHTMWALAP